MHRIHLVRAQKSDSDGSKASLASIFAGFGHSEELAIDACTHEDRLLLRLGKLAPAEYFLGRRT
ncbi:MULTISPECIES: hypothetical protein [unclassified Variovorax]|uniref:hypothetical protein n=1 Tax=unclassified Variovorax TaxID=663243 RepID=UPI000B83C69C|nr:MULTISPECIES: hypothetical protein [unclassified Variovorax]